MVLFPQVILPLNPFFATWSQTKGRYSKDLVCLGQLPKEQDSIVLIHPQFLKTKPTPIYDVHRTVKSLSFQKVKLFFLVK